MKIKKPMPDEEFLMPTELLEKVRMAFWILETAEIIDDESEEERILISVDRSTYDQYIEPLSFLHLH
jgi:hypothetical protein